ncbi:UNVERIFIED_ORG: VWA domain-containing protein [Roseateles sp. XES5]|nr:pilus assembly protein [Roseateles sp. XES5]
MTTKTEKRSFLSRFLGDRGGNFAVMAAVAVPVILGAGGFAMDLTRMVLMRAELQDAVDSAALAAASALSNDKKTVAEAKVIAMTFFKTQLVGSAAEGTDMTKTTTVNIVETAKAGSAKAFKVDIATGYDMQLNVLTRLFGQTTAKINTKGTAESSTGSKNAVSMFLVLDRSGSMSFKTDDIGSTTEPCQNWTESNWGGNPKWVVPCYIRKIAALKTAVGSLVDVMSKADPNSEYVRTGAISYNDSTQKETNLAWGTTAALNYVNALPTQPTGGTDSHTAFAKAVEKLTATQNGEDVEKKEHAAKNGLVPVKYLIFMTDGENTSYDNTVSTWGANESDEKTSASCTTAKNAGILVYTVAFMAPERGQKLLKSCASTPANYYEAKNRQDLIDAFNNIGKSAAAMVSRLTN